MTLDEYKKRTADIAKTIKDLQREHIDLTKQYLTDNNLNGDVEHRWPSGSKAELGTLIFDYDAAHGNDVLMFAPYTKSGKISEKGRIRLLSPDALLRLRPANADER